MAAPARPPRRPAAKAKPKPKRDSFGLSEGNYRAIIIVVTGVWLLSNILGLLAGPFHFDYKQPDSINPIFLATVVVAFGARTRVDPGDTPRGDDDSSKEK